MIAGDRDPLLDMRFNGGRLSRLTAGRSLGRLLIAYAVLAVLWYLAATGRLTKEDVAAMLAVLPMF